MTDAEYQRNVFWGLMEKELKEQGNPFLIKPQYSSGVPTQTADILKGDGINFIVNFLSNEGVLRIALYIYDAKNVYEFYRNNKERLKQVLGFEVDFSSGEKNEEIKWVKREWSFTPNDYDDYERVLRLSIPEMIRFVQSFKGYFE